jgi:hypothetical protein
VLTNFRLYVIILVESREREVLIMRKKTYIIKNSQTLTNIIDELRMNFACLIEREFIAMDYSKVRLSSYFDDFATLNTILESLM